MTNSNVSYASTEKAKMNMSTEERIKAGWYINFKELDFDYNLLPKMKGFEKYRLFLSPMTKTIDLIAVYPDKVETFNNISVGNKRFIKKDTIVGLVNLFIQEIYDGFWDYWYERKAVY